MPFRALSHLGVPLSQRVIDIGQLVAYLIIAAALALGFWRMQQVTDRNTTALDGLCAFRADLADRAVDTEAYIQDIEDGRRAQLPGITLNDLRRSLDGQLRTLAALASLDC